jgi:hypothetical protein
MDTGQATKIQKPQRRGDAEKIQKTLCVSVSPWFELSLMLPTSSIHLLSHA